MSKKKLSQIKDITKTYVYRYCDENGYCMIPKYQYEQLLKVMYRGKREKTKDAIFRKLEKIREEMGMIKG